ncbi:MAG: aspartate-semialdehyde dehydrogenase [Deltaproteobacteria bacterium]|nr:aspartate-semialdehyde dehydrogenase [Deltaproteobacteria bacterium]
MTHTLKVAVLGATGLVGRSMLEILEQRAFPVGELVPLASARSAGRRVSFGDREHEVRAVSEQAFEGVDLALFSAGAGPSREWAPIAAAAGALVIDNSSAHRMDPAVPLCVPEVNLEQARDPAKGIVANPNCSTIQLMVALAPLHRESPLRRIVVSTYQAVSGAGLRASECLEAQRRALAAGDEPEAGALGDVLAGDLLMHWSPDPATGYQEEELKLIHESRKILESPTLRVSPTCVRVPVVTGHAEAVSIECAAAITPERARELLRAAPGVELVDDFPAGVYPKPSMAAGRDAVLVGRVREDLGLPGGLSLYVVADNLRKGAALNAVQIAEGLLLP